MFNRNTQNLINSQISAGTMNTVAGFSLMHTKSFNSLKDLFEKDRTFDVPVEDEKKRQKRKEEEPKPLPETQTKASSPFSLRRQK
jgi:hypothetical protein